MSNATQPDIEIYLKRVETEEIMAWLETHFELQSSKTAGETIQVNLNYKGAPLTAIILGQAVKGGYTSLLFEPNVTPWSTDEACAAEAFQHFNREIRCSVGGWTPDAGDTEGWYRFTEAGKSVVNWLT